MDNNNLNTQNSSSMMNGMPPAPKHDRRVGPMVGALIIVLVLIIAAIYFFGQRLNTAPASDAAQQSSQQSAQTNNVSAAAATESDDVETLEAELGAELKDIEYSF